MATSNLVSKSLGDIQLQSGSGTPDHTGTTSNLYFDSGSFGLYKLNPIYSASNVTTTWDKISSNESLSIVSTTNSSLTASSTSIWYTMSGSSFGWTTQNSNGFSVSNGRVTLTGSSGDYYVNAFATIDYTATLANFRIGIGKNALNPVTGFYASGTLWATGQQYQTVNVVGVISLVSGDTLELAFNSSQSSTGTTSISGASLTLNKIL